jgi:uncharacterized protein (TIGR04255 family)
MFDHETFPNAPITEALIDIRVTFGSEFKLEELERLAEQCSDRFPEKETQFEHQHEVTFQDGGAGTESHTRSRMRGFVLFSEHREKAIQLRRDGFAFSKLKPYESWQALRDEANEHWKTYVAALQPARVTRLAVRFINRIEIPMGGHVDLEEYVITGPKLADGIPQAIAEFFLRIVIPHQEERNIRATITSRLEKKDGEVLAYVFDIDAYSSVDLDQNDEEVWNIFERLRDYKNLIFFSSTTEKAKDLFR